MSIASYITDYRMQKAKVLLLSSDLPIGTIAERTGFANGNYFFTLFKKHNGITPNEYRLVAERRPAQ
jgi:YesN/AraC family two-component response regulator